MCLAPWQCWCYLKRYRWPVAVVSTVCCNNSANIAYCCVWMWMLWWPYYCHFRSLSVSIFWTVYVHNTIDSHSEWWARRLSFDDNTHTVCNVDNNFVWQWQRVALCPALFCVPYRIDRLFECIWLLRTVLVVRDQSVLDWRNRLRMASEWCWMRAKIP